MTFFKKALLSNAIIVGFIAFALCFGANVLFLVVSTTALLLIANIGLWLSHRSVTHGFPRNRS
jgi:hypothetical protein